jgi:heme exporter protein B
MRTAVGALLRKELGLELRAPQAVPAMALFSITTLVVFHFALQRGQVEGDLASGVLWVTLLFAAMLGISRLFVADHEEGGLDGFLLAPTDRTAMLVAKALGLFAFLAVVEIVAVPAFALMLLGPSPPLRAYGELAVLLALADAGIALIGTMVGAMAVQTRARDLIVPLMALPLLMPVIIGAAKGTTPLVLQAGSHGLEVRWLLILGLYDLVFGLLAYALFDYLIED